MSSGNTESEFYYFEKGSRRDYKKAVKTRGSLTEICHNRDASLLIIS